MITRIGRPRANRIPLTCVSPTLRPKPNSRKPSLRLADGRPFAFICSTAGYPWRDEGADAILLFFEPETRTAVLTLDWG